VVVTSLRTSLKQETNDLIGQEGAVDEILEAHEAIYQQIADRSPEGAARTMASHLADMETRMIRESESKTRGK
jgi:DNA-binding FadR family transcriptional regulator